MKHLCNTRCAVSKERDDAIHTKSKGANSHDTTASTAGLKAASLKAISKQHLQSVWIHSFASLPQFFQSVHKVREKRIPIRRVTLWFIAISHLCLAIQQMIMFKIPTLLAVMLIAHAVHLAESTCTSTYSKKLKPFLFIPKWSFPNSVQMHGILHRKRFGPPRPAMLRSRWPVLRQLAHQHLRSQHWQ